MKQVEPLATNATSIVLTHDAGEMNQHTKQALEEQVGCAMPIPTKDRYLELLGQAGFVDVEFEDVTSSVRASPPHNPWLLSSSC
jgi:hypothetical protein